MKYLILILLFASNAYAMPGMDYLGLAKFCNAALEAHPNGTAVGAFIDTFGDSLPCLEQFVRNRKADTFRVHLAWSDTHQFNPRDFDNIAAKAVKLNLLAGRYPNHKFYVSGACEHNLDATQAKILRAKVLAKCPRCAGYSNSVWKGATIDGVNEVHGDSPRKPSGQYIVSYDGDSAVDSDVTLWKSKYSDALIQFLWEPRFNGRWETNDSTPRPNRKGWPDAKFIQSVAFLFTDRGAVGKLGKTDIYKSHSENKGNGDPRAEKPVAILGIKVPEISLVSVNGKEIAKARYYGSFEGNRSRYYFPAYGFELAKKANGLTFIKAGKTKLGPVNAGFRAGVFR
jgi:hypothetical protein